MGISGGSFGGVQPALNNALGTESAIASGGALPQIGKVGQGTLTQSGQIGRNMLSQGNQAGQNILNEAQNYGNQIMSQQNPYLAKYANAAALPMIQNYQNAIAPNLLANFASNGTVGGSGQQQAFGLAESGLAQGLGNLNASIYEPAWAQSQQLAANMYGQGLGEQAGLTGQGLSGLTGLREAGLSNLGNLESQGLGLTQGALSNIPNLASAAYIPSQQLMQSGALGQNQAQNVLNTGYQNLYNQATWPYQELNMLGQGFGNYPQGTGTQQTTSTGNGSMK